MPGTSLVAPPLPSTANLASSAALSCTASSRPTFFTTTYRPSHSTTQTRRPRPSSQSWVVTTAQTSRMVRSASCSPSGAALDGASGSSQTRAQQARSRRSSSSATETVLVCHLQRWQHQAPRRARWLLEMIAIRVADSMRYDIPVSFPVIRFRTI